MKLRSLLHRRHADQVPLLPAIEPEIRATRDTSAPRTTHPLVTDEQLERLLTPTELDFVREHRV
ncbi:hypothetical protein [Nocardia anaemiae]|uniref:hypothetical protein n=1 Tax=Nocardia anaemiae TaxID=263910 RepID=UPI0007A41172|nr:hypothetical protein [Nocardia anaemiae]